MKPKVFLTRRLPPAVMERLERETDFAWHQADRAATPAELIAGLKGQEAILCTILDRVDAALLNACPGLKVISNFGVGYNHIDVAAASARRIPVTNTPNVLTDATADLAFSLLLATARRLGEGERLVRARQWTGWEPMQLLGTEVTGATLGILGFGRIGRAVARRAAGFDMRVLYWNRTQLSSSDESATGATYAPFEDVLRQSDFLSVHVAASKDTQHLLGEPQFALMKPGAIVINTSRGNVIDEAALVRALRSGHLGGAGLDVYEREPEIEADLYRMENVLLSPHLGSSTLGTRTKMGMLAVDNLLAVCAGRRPLHCVNPEVLV